ncbi:MAG: FMN-binding negative transcriptional regulator [Steroidobacteraceae bacterium]
MCDPTVSAAEPHEDDVYCPETFAESRLEVLHDLIRAHPLGTLVTVQSSALEADHIPFLLDADRGVNGTLRGHASRANPLCRRLADSAEALIVFQGPQSYISPSWYPSKRADGKVVPTWNYAVVHAYGSPRIIDDAAWLLGLVTELTSTHEADRAAPWKVSDAPREYTDRMIRQIVGIEIPIARLQGKWKVSQNRSPADRRGVAEGLQSEATERCAALARLVGERDGTT